jgi:hypothetical protein
VKVISLFATLTVPTLPNGPNSVTAVYSGDANFNGSTSTAQTVTVANPDFQTGVNPGILTVSTSAPGKATLLLSPGPGLGFVGTVSLSCSGLPSGSACTFLPPQVFLDGFTPASSAVTITESSAGASLRAAGTSAQMMLASAAAGLGFVGVLLIPWSAKSRKRHWTLFAIAMLACFIAPGAGCGGGNSSQTQSTTPTPSPSGKSYTVMLTATGGSGTTTVTHSVSMQVNFQ